MFKQQFSLATLLFLTILMLPYCGNPDICVLGETQMCTCPGETKGAQTCRTDKKGWQKCECPKIAREYTSEEPHTQEQPAVETTVDASETNTPENLNIETSREQKLPDDSKCVDGTIRPCYDGPDKTVNIGLCKEGSQTCKQGQWETCLNSVKPTQEICDELDNDCNGKVDDGLNCPSLPVDNLPVYQLILSQ